MDLLTAHLRREEGERLYPYKDHLGFWTIGVGHLIDRRKGGFLPNRTESTRTSPTVVRKRVKPWSFPITKGESRKLLELDILEKCSPLYTRLPWMSQLSEERRVVLYSMAFQMGIRGLLGFRNTLRFIKNHEYERAARGMLRSKWARIDTPERAKRMSEVMRTGVLEV